jgi:hypothetical protein
VATTSAVAEPIRFSLLVVLTVGLLAVAFRIDDHPHARSHTHALARPQTVPSAAVPQVRPTPRVRPHHPTGVGASARHTGTGATTGSTAAGAEVGTGPASARRPILPVTGWPMTARLLAGGFVLIGLGMATMRMSVPRRRGQRG